MNKILTYKEFEKIELKKINSIYINANLIFNKTHRVNTNNTTATNIINIQKPMPPINNYLDLEAIKKIIETLYIIYVASINNIFIEHRHIHNINLKRNTLSYWIYERNTKYKHIKIKIKGTNYCTKNDNIALIYKSGLSEFDEWSESYKNKVNTYDSTVELIKGFYNHYIVYKRHYKNIMEHYNEFIWQGNYIVNYINSFTNRDVKDILIYYYHKFLY